MKDSNHLTMVQYDDSDNFSSEEKEGLKPPACYQINNKTKVLLKNDLKFLRDAECELFIETDSKNQHQKRLCVSAENSPVLHRAMMSGFLHQQQVQTLQQNSDVRCRINSITPRLQLQNIDKVTGIAT